MNAKPCDQPLKIEGAAFGDGGGQPHIAMRPVLSGSAEGGPRASERSVSVAVSIDGRPVTLGSPWDVLALVASGRTPGGYYLGNCNCGEPRCAGVPDPVQVRHEAERITWDVPQPYDPGLRNEPGDGVLRLTFDASHYRAQTESLIEGTRSLPQTVAVCCYPIDQLRRVIEWADAGGAGYGGFVSHDDRSTAT